MTFPTSTRFSSLILLGLLSGCVAATDDTDVDGVSGEVNEPLRALGHTPVASKELFITDLSVVNATSYTNYTPGQFNWSAAGGFSFGRLIDNLSPVERPTDQQRSNTVMNWLRLWETPQTVNGQTIAARPLIREKLITPWKLASVGKLGNTSATCAADPATDFTCKLSFAPDVVPFRLLAIVNRPDLRRLPVTGVAGSGSAAQGRFVFGVLDAARVPMPFTVIFEYMVPVSSVQYIQGYADLWHKLGTKAFGSSFNQSLHLNTIGFTRWRAAPSRNNGSALLQIRTNEVALANPGSDPTSPRGGMWELREFVVGPSGGLEAETVKQEPPIALSGSDLLRDWVAANSTAVRAGKHDVPSVLPTGEPFLAASSFTPFSFSWQVPGATEELRHAFAISTCNGCHRNETATAFLHVRNREPGVAAGLSPWLTAELAPTGPRIADFSTLLTQDVPTIQTGPGKDHGDDEDENDGDGNDDD